MQAASFLSIITVVLLIFTGKPGEAFAQGTAFVTALLALFAFFMNRRSFRKRETDPVSLSRTETEKAAQILSSRNLEQMEQAMNDAHERISKFEAMMGALSGGVFTDALILLPLGEAVIKAVPVKTEEAAFTLMEKFMEVREASGRASASARSLRTDLEDTRSEKSIHFTAENSRKAVQAERISIRELSLCTRENRDNLKAMSREIETGLELLRNITEITEQSKLIAFNMSIEAARMGEKGRGVKVITTELHKLNDRTFDFSRQVANLLGRFKDYNSLLVANMEEKAGVVVTQVEKGIDASEAAVESLIGASTRTENFTREIALMSEEINHGLDGVLESLQFQDITRQMIEGAQAILQELRKGLDACLEENNIPIDHKVKNERFTSIKERLIAGSKTKDEKNALAEVQL